MKHLLILVSFIFLSNASAENLTIEFDDSQEALCHEEMKILGCVDKKGDENQTCVVAKAKKLSQACQNIHAVKMNNRK